MNTISRENEVLFNEVALLESEDTRLRKENATLKSEVSRLDKLVYGGRSKARSSAKTNAKHEDNVGNSNNKSAHSHRSKLNRN